MNFQNSRYAHDDVSYSALHYRVVAQRGKPQKCEECGTTEGKMQWSNLNGRYEDIDDYARLCIRCHRRIDLERRIETGEMTSMNGSYDGKFRHAPRAILTEEQVLEAKQLRKEGWTWVKLGKRYGVVGNTIKFAVIGKNWPHLREGASSTSKLS